MIMIDPDGTQIFIHEVKRFISLVDRH